MSCRPRPPVLVIGTLTTPSASAWTVTFANAEPLLTVLVVVRSTYSSAAKPFALTTNCWSAAGAAARDGDTLRPLP